MCPSQTKRKTFFKECLHKHDRKGPEMCAKQPERPGRGIMSDAIRIRDGIGGGGVGSATQNQLKSKIQPLPIL